MRRQDKYKNIEQANLMLENYYLKSKGLLKEGLDDEYDYSNAEKNPDYIIIKFAPGGYNKFWDQYVKSNDPSYYRKTGENWVYYGSWSDLSGEGLDSDGLEMRDGEYYLLFKNYNPKDVSDWISKGRPSGKNPGELYFLKYNKEAGEIGVYSSDATEYNYLEASKDYNFRELKGNSRQLTYCRIEKDGRIRLVEPGSIDHRGYFEIISVR